MPEIATPLLSHDDISRTLLRVAHEIVEKSRKQQAPALVGIRIRGDVLAERLRRLLEDLYETPLVTGAQDLCL